MFLAPFISWFANVVASNVLATSTTWRSLTFSWVVLCLCPFPISFTRRASDVRPAINWSLMSSSAKSWYSHSAAWFRIFVSNVAIDSFSSCSRRRSFCRSPETPGTVFVHRSSRRRQRFLEACHGFIRLGPLDFVSFFRCIVPILHYAVICQILDVSLKITLFVYRCFKLSKRCFWNHLELSWFKTPPPLPPCYLLILWHGKLNVLIQITPNLYKMWGNCAVCWFLVVRAV